MSENTAGSSGVTTGGEKINRDAIERTGRDIRDRMQQGGGKDPGHDGAIKIARDAVLRQDRRNRK